MNQPQTIVQCILNFPHRNQGIATQYKKDDQWIKISWTEYFEAIKGLSLALHKLNLPPQSKIALLSQTRYEWGLVDAATMCSGFITVPIYANSTADEVEYILNHSEAEVLFLENEISLRLWKKIETLCPKIKKVFVFESHQSISDPIGHLDDLIKSGIEESKTKSELFFQKAALVKAEDVASIVYTSGTTGTPKGVVCLHSQIISEVGEAFPLCGMTPEDISLAFLPFAHVLGRVELWGHMFIGFTITYAESIDLLRKNLREIQPTIMIAVPRIFEKIYSGIFAQMENQKLKLKLFKWALKVGKEVGEYKLTRSLIPVSLLSQYLVADKLIFSKIREAFGGKLRFCISGGAPLSAEISTFFHSAGILILEGYGLTETTAAICVNTPFNYKFGSVGRPIGDTQLKIAEDGEVLVKSKKVMKEYYKNPKATEEVLKDGWFATGDIGVILPGGDLRITDRKKDLIKTAGGKYVAPQKLELLLKTNPLVTQALIHGDQKKYIVALITLDRGLLEKMAQQNNWEFQSWQEVTQKREVYEIVRQIISKTNSQLASFESIKKFLVLPTEFTVEGGELTPSLKIKRKFLDKKYQQEIASLYE